MLRRIVRDPRNLPFAIAVLVALLAVPDIPSPVMRPSAGWRGRYVLLYRERVAPAVEAALDAAARGSVSRRTATVRIDAFSEIETLPMAAVGTRLDTLDPRWDAWLSGIHRFFRASDGGGALVAAYLPAACGRLVIGLRLARAFRAGGVPGGSWRLLELEPLVALPVPAAALCFAFIVAGGLRRSRRHGLRAAVPGVLVWLPGLLNGGMPELFLCCTALHFWIPRALEAVPAPRGWCDPRRPGSTGARLGALLCVAGAVIAANDAAVYRIARMSASVLSLVLLTELSEPLHRLHSGARRTPGRLEPVPIRTSRRKAALAPLAAVVAAVLIAALPAFASPLRLPLPQPAAVVRAASWLGIAVAGREGDPNRLPALEEAVAHAAALQTVAFGDVGTASPSLPPRDGRVLLREYVSVDGSGSLAEAPRTVARFDPAWSARFIAGSADGSVERLLAEQRRETEVRVRPPWATLPSALPAALACLLVLAAPPAAAALRRLLIRLGLWAITDPAQSSRTR
jgi:hypothetical protein